MLKDTHPSHFYQALIRFLLITMRGFLGDWADCNLRDLVLDTRLLNTNKRNKRPVSTLHSRRETIDANWFFLHLDLYDYCDASSSVHHYIDGTQEHLSPSERGPQIELYTWVFVPVSFCLVEPILSFSWAAAPRHITVRGRGCLLLGQPSVCNHSGCCGADWCSCVGPRCRWVISRSQGYTSLPLINCPINPAT